MLLRNLLLLTLKDIRTLQVMRNSIELGLLKAKRKVKVSLKEKEKSVMKKSLQILKGERRL